MPSTCRDIEPVDDPYYEVAPHYDKAIGSLDQRSDQYKSFFANTLKQHGCRYVLDASCGTGVDSAILLEHGFQVVSTDASARMLEYAKKMKRDRAGDPRYDGWIIERASWETLPEDIARFLPAGTQFDGVVCLANSYAHILDDDGKQTMQKKCLRNLARVVKPGGILLLDHRNYDAVLNNIQPSAQNAYYTYRNEIEIKTELVTENGIPKMLITDYYVDINVEGVSKEKSKIRLHFYPHRLDSLSRMLDDAFDRSASHCVYGDFLPLGRLPVPGFYLHVMRKSTGAELTADSGVEPPTATLE